MGKWEKFEQGDRVKVLVYGNDDIQEMEFRAGTIIYPLNFIPDDGTQILEIELDKPDFKGNKRISSDIHLLRTLVSRCCRGISAPWHIAFLVIHYRKQENNM